MSDPKTFREKKPDRAKAISKLLEGVGGNNTIIGQKLGVGHYVPRDWKTGGFIPLCYWPRLYEHGITIHQIVSAHGVPARR